MINTNTKSPVLIGLTTTLQLKPQRKKKLQKKGNANRQFHCT